MIASPDNRHPGDAEAAAAIAAMTETYGTAWTPTRGETVRCPKAFGDGHQRGVVYGTADGGFLVDTAEGRLLLYADEIERA